MATTVVVQEIKRIAHEHGKRVGQSYIEMLSEFVRTKVEKDCQKDQKKTLVGIHAMYNGGLPTGKVIGLAPRIRRRKKP